MGLRNVVQIKQLRQLRCEPGVHAGLAGKHSAISLVTPVHGRPGSFAPLSGGNLRRKEARERA